MVDKNSTHGRIRSKPADVKTGLSKGAPVDASKEPTKQNFEDLILAFLPQPPDFRLQNEGSIVLLHPLTPNAVAWVNENIGADSGYQPMWPSVLIEPRYVEPIVQGIADAGMSVA